MPLLQLLKVDLAVGGPKLLDGVDFTIDPRERVCIVGRNGMGKSALLRLIADEMRPDDGEVRAGDGVRIATLAQEVLFLAPWIVAALNAGFTASEDDVLPVTAVLATVAIAYAFGEGTGRLACLSFGCCYGAPLTRSHPWIAGLFAHHHTVFAGETRKAAYESGLESVPLVPIQAMTAAVSVATGMAGLWLFFHGRMAAAFLFTVVVTQMWRVGSECLCADYRGGMRVSWYQVLSLAGIAYAAFLTPRSSSTMPGYPSRSCRR